MNNKTAKKLRKQAIVMSAEVFKGEVSPYRCYKRLKKAYKTINRVNKVKNL